MGTGKPPRAKSEGVSIGFRQVHACTEIKITDAFASFEAKAKVFIIQYYNKYGAKIQ